MKARPILMVKETDKDIGLIEIAVWRVPMDFRHPDGVRYRLAFIPNGYRKPTVLYDNHYPKGHHKHIEGFETPYHFMGVVHLHQDFDNDVEVWKKKQS